LDWLSCAETVAASTPEIIILAVAAARKKCRLISAVCSLNSKEFDEIIKSFYAAKIKREFNGTFKPKDAEN
jgi:hypothetical protein